MAAIKLPKFASDINLDVPREQMLAESAYALKHIEGHLIHHLWIGRTLVRALGELAERGINRQSGHYSSAFNAWIKENQPKLDGLHKNLRADSIWCIENWPNVQPILKRIEQDDPRLHQMLGARGLRALVEKEMTNIDKPRNKLEPKEVTLSPTQKLGLVAKHLQNIGMSWSEAGIGIDDFRQLEEWIAEMRAATARNLGPAPAPAQPHDPRRRLHVQEAGDQGLGNGDDIEEPF